MDNLKLYGKTERDLQSLVHTVRIISKDIGMEFGMYKCSTLRIKEGKISEMEDMEMPNGQRINQIEESRCKYLGIIQDSEIKTQIIKDKIRTEYLWRVRKLEKSELYARNVFMGINQWALGVVSYITGIVDWTRGDLELLDRKTRKILTSNGLFHPRAEVVLEKKRRRKRINIGQRLCSKWMQWTVPSFGKIRRAYVEGGS